MSSNLLCNEPQRCSPSTPEPSTWDDDFIYSLSSPYSKDPLFAERIKELVESIKKDVSDKLDKCKCENRLTSCLNLVEYLDCLGIDRHFNMETREALDYVMRQWKEYEDTNETSRQDLLCTSMAFRLLRFHRYQGISADCFLQYKNRDGSFSGIEMDMHGNINTKAVRSALALLRASHIQFPEDTILEEAKKFATNFLNTWLETQNESSNLHPHYLAKQVKHVLKYEWYNSSPRWEARSFVNLYGEDCEWLKSGLNRKILELAQLDYNCIQAMHQDELKDLLRWWNKSQVSHMNMVRKRPVVALFSGAVGIFEPEFRNARISIGKATMAHFVLDDTYDTNGTLEEVNLMTEAIQQWDASLLLPVRESIKTCFQFVLEAFSELGEDTSNMHGVDLGAYMNFPTQQVAKVYQREEQWIGAGEVPTLEEYLINFEDNNSIWPLVVAAELYMCDPSLIKTKQGRLPKVSKLLKECSRTMRILDDMVDYLEYPKGEAVKSVECLLKEKLGYSSEDALCFLHEMVRESIKHIAKLYFSPEYDTEEEPLMLKRIAFEVARATYLLLNDGDGYSKEPQIFKDLVALVFFDPVPLTT